MFSEDRVRLVALHDLYAFYDAQDHAFEHVMGDPGARLITPADIAPRPPEPFADAGETWSNPGLPPLLVAALHLQRQGRRFGYVDVGANVGLTVFSAALFFKRLGWTTPCWAYEPHPGVFDLMHRGLEANGLAGAVVARPVALSDETGAAVFHTTPAQTPASSLIKAAVTREFVVRFEDVEVPVRRLDDELEAAPDLDLVLKIDAEGADFKVMDGMGALLTGRTCIGQFEFFPMVLSTYADPAAYLQKMATDFMLFDITGPTLRRLDDDRSSFDGYVAEVAARRPVGIGDVFFIARSTPAVGELLARLAPT